MRRYKRWLCVLTAVAAGIFIQATLSFVNRAHTSASRSICQSNMKRIALAVIQYRQDNDEYFSPARVDNLGLTSANNWAAALGPYLPDAGVFQCPLDRESRPNESSSYGYNVHLSRRSLKDTKAESQVIILHFEVRADPDNWLQIGRSPKAVTAATRHSDGANYSFVDGHVKWYRPDKITMHPPQKNQPTFTPS